MRSKIMRIPKELLFELNSVQQNEKVIRKCDGLKKIAEYAKIGREIVHKDLLNANVLWFNVQNKKGKGRK